MEKLAAHPSREELSAYSLGQLSEERAVAIDSHISECEPCCETIVKLSSEDTFAGLLQEAGRLPTDQTAVHDIVTPISRSAPNDIPPPLSEHPRYEVLGLIGKGGMGDVYRARHRKMERTVALKVINRGLVQKAEAIDRFHREVKAAAQLSHPNIVTSHDADHAGDFHFMVMEFIEGVDLSQTVKKRGALPVAEACDYIRQAAMGLQHAHERGMVHRDIKPHNMMVTQDRVVKILDFGLASLAPQATPGEPISEDANGNLTVAGAIMGTPDFISPEQARDARQVDGRSDIYSLGMTLYYLLAGRAPFGEGSAIEKLKKQAEAEPEPLSRFREDVPAELENIIHRMTAKKPAERFQSPQEVADALQPFASELPIVSKPQPAPQKTRAAGGSIVKWISAAILFAMLGAGGLSLLNLSDPETDYKSLDKFLATGVSDEPAGDIVRRLLRTEEGRQFLRKLDARHPTLAYTEGQFARGYTSVAAFAYENRITGVAQPELLVIGWGPTVSGMKTCNVVESFTLESIDFDNAPDNTCLATLQFKTPQNEKRALGLKVQSLYEVEIPIQTLIEGRLSMSDEFKKGKFVGNAPKDSSEPTDPQIVSDSNLNHQTDMPGGPGEQGLDSVFQQKESTTKAQATEHVGEVQATRPFSFDLSLVPANAQQVIGARPGNILRDPQLAKLRENAPPLAGFTSLFVNENVAEVLAITLSKPSRMSNPRVIVLTVEQGDAMEEVDRAIGIQKLGRGDAESEYKSTGYVSREGRLLVRRIDRQTVVLGTRKELDGHKLAMNVPMPNELREVSKGMQDCEAFLIANPHAILDFGPEKASANAGAINEILKQLRFVHGEAKFVTATVSLGEKPRLQFSVRAKAQERNHEVAMAVSEIRDQAMTLIRGNLNQLSDELFFKDQESAAAATASLLLSRVTEPTPQDTLLDVPLMPAMSPVVKMLGEQFDAKKLQRDHVRFSMQNISLGFFQFESQHGYLPSASTKIPGAAHPVSWRVAILPYVGQEKLYAQYKLDEPWDSEHNKSLLANMPELYRHPSSWRQSTETNVVSFVGADTAVGTGDEPVRLEDFQDDLGLTILVAESATGIPWTKPEDVPFTAGEPLPPIGGLGVEGWNAVFADGSVQFVPRNTSTDVIAAMLTRNGGESVQVEDGKFSLRKVGE